MCRKVSKVAEHKNPYELSMHSDYQMTSIQLQVSLMAVLQVVFGM